jgi:hypothetical protein
VTLASLLSLTLKPNGDRLIFVRRKKAETNAAARHFSRSPRQFGMR